MLFIHFGNAVTETIVPADEFDALDDLLDLLPAYALRLRVHGLKIRCVCTMGRAARTR